MAITITAQGTEPRATQGAIRNRHKLHTWRANFARTAFWGASKWLHGF